VISGFGQEIVVKNFIETFQQIFHLIRHHEVVPFVLNFSWQRKNYTLFDMIACI